MELRNVDRMKIEGEMGEKFDRVQCFGNEVDVSFGHLEAEVEEGGESREEGEEALKHGLIEPRCPMDEVEGGERGELDAIRQRKSERNNEVPQRVEGVREEKVECYWEVWVAGCE